VRQTLNFPQGGLDVTTVILTDRTSLVFWHVSCLSLAGKGDQYPVTKKRIVTVLTFVVLAGMAWAGEPAKANEEEITLPAIKISKIKNDQPAHNYALAKKDSGKADQSGKKDIPADKVEGAHSM
jgi:hypothetical protein